MYATGPRYWSSVRVEQTMEHAVQVEQTMEEMRREFGVQHIQQHASQGMVRGLGGPHGMEIGWIAQAAQQMDPGVAEQVTCNAIYSLQFAVSLADPSLVDCPLIGVSAGFEALTGYARTEVIGHNCRFLSWGIEDQAKRDRMRKAVKRGLEFVGVLQNKRKNGEVFLNLLHLAPMEVCNRKYIIGIQADVTHVELDLGKASHSEYLKATAERIFETSVDSWARMQAREYSMSMPASYSQMLRVCSPEVFQEKRDQFVRLGMAAAARSSAKTRPSVPLETPNKGVSKNSGLSNSNAPTSMPSIARAQPGPDPPSNRIAAQESQAPGGEWSAGSAGHPNSCTECNFYLFSPTGCRYGADCTYCHAIHPRLNRKKNKRFMKRICNIGRGALDGSAPNPQPDTDGKSDTSSTVQAIDFRNEPDTASETKSTVAEAFRDEAAGSFLPLASTNVAASIASLTAVSPNTPAALTTASPNTPAALPRAVKKMPGEDGLEAISLWYAEKPGHTMEDQLLGLVTGVSVDIAPHLDVPAEKRQALEGSILFAAEPSLPVGLGLSLDPRSGVISGTPLKALREPSSHVITASVAATGPCGIPLGTVPFTSCAVSLCIFDWGQLELTSATEDSCEDQSAQFILRLHTA